MARPAILFVDDDAAALDGFAQQLKLRRGDWDIEFAHGAKVARRALEERTFDVVISDKKVLELRTLFLERVKEIRPDAVRIMFSDKMDVASSMSSVNVAHQFLFKTCEPATLDATLVRALALHPLVNNPKVRTLVAGVENLPSPPRLQADLARVIAQPTSTSRDIAKVIEKDPAMAAKLLQLVNSSYFGVGRRMTVLEHAVAYLGVALVRQLILVQESLQAVSGTDDRRTKSIRRASLLAAALCRRLPCPAYDRDDLFLATLLADIGLLLLASRLTRIHDVIEVERGRRGGSRSAMEHEFLGVSHGEIGAYFLGLWGFSMPVVLAVARHHTRPAPDAPPLEHRVWLASWLAEEAIGVPGMDPVAPDRRPDFPEEELDHFRLMAKEVLGSGTVG